MSDCEKCWSTPCECGHDYQRRSLAWLTEMRDLFAKLVTEWKPPEPEPPRLSVAASEYGRSIEIPAELLKP